MCDRTFKASWKERENKALLFPCYESKKVGKKKNEKYRFSYHKLQPLCHIILPYSNFTLTWIKAWSVGLQNTPWFIRVSLNNNGTYCFSPHFTKGSGTSRGKRRVFSNCSTQSLSYFGSLLVQPPHYYNPQPHAVKAGQPCTLQLDSAVCLFQNEKTKSTATLPSFHVQCGVKGALWNPVVIGFIIVCTSWFSFWSFLIVHPLSSFFWRIS